MGYARFRRYQRGAHCESVDKYTEQVKHFLNGRKGLRPTGLWRRLHNGYLQECVGNLLTNPGKAADYQNWDLVKKSRALQDCRATKPFRHGFREILAHGHNDQP